MSGYAGNTLRQNLIYDNEGGGIVLTDGGNNGAAPPVITSVSATGVSGTSCPACEVEVFSDSAGEGQIFEGSTFADASGAFRFYKGSYLIGPKITATATDSQGNSSGLSAPKAFPSSFPGDVNEDGAISLADAILALQILAGINTAGQTLLRYADVTGDGKIGMAEAIYILQKAAGIR